jgi:serine/threonine-protein kinase ULK/ATG1
MVKQVGKYVLNKQIGQGQFGTVYSGKHKTSKLTVAVKEMALAGLSEKLLQQMELEIKAMKKVRHSAVISLHDVYKTKQNVYLMMEYCTGGDLESYVEKNGPISEATLKRWLKQLVSAFIEMQSHRILHRDLKLGNLLLTDPDAEVADVKLADFGFARILNENSMAKTTLGTPLFMAPEILNGQEYDYKVDVWSLGALCFEILTGKSAFNATTMAQLRRLQKTKVTFPRGCKASRQARAFIGKMLTYDQKKRPSFADLEAHKYLA